MEEEEEEEEEEEVSRAAGGDSGGLKIFIIMAKSSNAGRSKDTALTRRG